MITLYKTWERRSATTVSASTYDVWKTVLVSMKDLMVASGHWSVVYSCDSTAVGVGPANDKWIAWTNLIHLPAGQAHSWIVLQNTNTDPSGTFQICLDYNHASSSTVNYHTSIYCTHEGYNNDGTILNRPTAIGSECLIANDQQYMASPETTQRINLLTSSDGQCTRIIFTAPNSLSGSARPWIFDRLKSPASWLTHPYLVCCFPRSATVGDYNFLSEAECWPSFTSYGGTGASARAYHNSNVIGVSFASIGVSSLYLRTAMGALSDPVSGSYLPIPIIATSVSSVVPGMLGEMFDLYWLSGLFADDVVSTPSNYTSPFIYLPATGGLDLGFFSHGAWLYGNDGNGGLF